MPSMMNGPLNKNISEMQTSMMNILIGVMRANELSTAASGNSVEISMMIYDG
eukprot:m.98421 g.98421  ORF g.98421 m.98421 type:complete len:52 (+) comp16745_c0_seq5:1687-1842(+)